MLDSSPVAHPAISAIKSLKRSSSTASLPTPPRTYRRNTRGRSRGSCDSDSENDAKASSVMTDEDGEDGNDTKATNSHKHKKRRIRLEEDGKDEDAFWLGDSSSAVQPSSSKNVLPLLYRRKQAEVDVAPASPPLSHRKAPAAAIVKPNALIETPKFASLPSTPKMKSSSSVVHSLYPGDSPENPFLESPVADSDTCSPSGNSANASPHTPGQFQEKPTIAYVFRGVRRVFQNPLYNMAENRPYSPPPNSKLPITHPDFSPSMHCPPKILFPEARKKKGKHPAQKPLPLKGKKGSSAFSDEEDEDEDLTNTIQPKRLDFGTARTLDKELKTAGEPLY